MAKRRQGRVSWCGRTAPASDFRRRAGAGDLEKAVGFFTDGITAMGATPELWRGRGLALLKLGQTDSAKQDLKEYLKRAPDAPDKAMIAMMAGG